MSTERRRSADSMRAAMTAMSAANQPRPIAAADDELAHGVARDRGQNRKCPPARR